MAKVTTIGPLTIRTALTVAVVALCTLVTLRPASACDSYEEVRAMLSGNVFLDENSRRIFATDPSDSRVPVGEPLGWIGIDRVSYSLRRADGLVLAAIERSLRLWFSGIGCDNYEMQIYPATRAISVVASGGKLIGTITGRLPDGDFFCRTCNRGGGALPRPTDARK